MAPGADQESFRLSLPPEPFGKGGHVGSGSFRFPGRVGLKWGRNRSKLERMKPAPRNAAVFRNTAHRRHDESSTDRTSFNRPYRAVMHAALARPESPRAEAANGRRSVQEHSGLEGN